MSKRDTVRKLLCHVKRNLKFRRTSQKYIHITNRSARSDPKTSKCKSFRRPRRSET